MQRDGIRPSCSSPRFPPVQLWYLHLCADAGIVGAAISVPLVRIGVRLGLYKAMHGSGPMTSAEFADKANISERYAREWLAQNAASGYLSYEPSSRRFELPPEQAMVFANEESPFFLGGGFDAVAALYQTQPLI